MVDTFHGLLHPAESDYQYTDVQYSLKLFTGISKRSGWAFGNCCIRGKQRFLTFAIRVSELSEASGGIPASPAGKFSRSPQSLPAFLLEAHFMSRSLFLCGLAVALSFAVGSLADAGFGHHRRQADPGCAAPEGVGCSQFEPGCALEPDCGAETCCPTNPCIKYRHKHAHKHKCAKGCCEEPTYETVLNPTSPETCQTVAVPVCLPACCQGCPCETSRCTLLGCGQVKYDYACGCSVIVRFQKHGDILVTYSGF